MSRALVTHRAHVAVPDSVHLEIHQGHLRVQGPLGTCGVDLRRWDPQGLAQWRVTSDRGEDGASPSTMEGSASPSTMEGSASPSTMEGRPVVEGVRTQWLTLLSPSRAMCHLYRGLVQGLIQGVTKGVVRYLRVQGTGYRLEVSHTPTSGQVLVLRVGLGHEVLVRLPSGLRAYALGPTMLCLWGVHPGQVGQVAAQVCALRPPNPYGGQGIHLVGARVVTRAGKGKAR